MRKIFALIVSAVCLALGVLSLIDGIICFTALAGAGQVQRDAYLVSGISYTAFFGLSLVCFIATFLNIITFRKIGHAATWAVLSLSTFILSQAVGLFASWNMYNITKSVSQETITTLLVAMIIAFVSGGCLLISCINHFPLRKLFGIVGSLIGVAVFGILCLGIGTANITTTIIILVGLVTFILGFILMLAIPKKNKIVKEN